MSKRPSVQERAINAEVLASQWLADGNEASESGDLDKAEWCYGKAQFWLDRSNLLSGRAANPAPHY